MIAYGELETRFGRLGAIEEAIAVLHRDASAMMPDDIAEKKDVQ